MTITIDRKRKKSIDVFPKIEDFILYLKEYYNNINFHNDDIKSSILIIYNKLINSDGNIRYLRLSRWLPSQFGFKHSNKFSLPFWIERGFTKNDYNDFTKSIFKERSERLTKYSKDLKNDLYEFDINYSNIYKYNNTEYESLDKPVCNLCGSELILKKSVIKNKKVYIIEDCSNKNCKSCNKSKRDLRWMAFLPEDKYKEIKDNLKNTKRAFSKEFWIKKGYTEEDAIKKVYKIQSENSKKFKGKRTGKSKDVLRKKGYTEEQIKEVSLTPANIEFWIKKGYTEEDAKNIIFRNQKNASKNVDYDKRLLPSNIEYWLKKGYNEEESKELVSKSQTTFSKDICIEKWGYEKGIEIFNNRQKKWQKSLYKNGNIKGGYSKISQELFFEIKKRINGEFKFAKNGGEFCIRVDKNYYYDFLDVVRKKIIEYHGDRYHANPKIYKENDYPHPYHSNNGLTAADIWNKDNIKLKEANIRGYEVLVIWDSEYKKDKEKVIQNCINFLLNK